MSKCGAPIVPLIYSFQYTVVGTLVYSVQRLVSLEKGQLFDFCQGAVNTEKFELINLSTFFRVC